MLRAWTITDGGMGLIFTSAPSPNGLTVTHPTRQQAPPLGSEAEIRQQAMNSLGEVAEQLSDEEKKAVAKQAVPQWRR